MKYFSNTSVLYPFKYYVIKCGGRGGKPKHDFVWYGGREGLEKGQIVLHNTWTAPKQSWNTHETAMKHCWNTTPPHGFLIFPNWNWNIFEKKRWENTIKTRKEDARLIPSIFWSYIQAKLGPLHGRTPSPPSPVICHWNVIICRTPPPSP